MKHDKLWCCNGLKPGYGSVWCVCDSRLEVENVEEVHDDGQVIHGDGGVHGTLQRHRVVKVKSKYIQELFLSIQSLTVCVWSHRRSVYTSPWRPLGSTRLGPSPGSCCVCSASHTWCRDLFSSETEPRHHSELPVGCWETSEERGDTFSFLSVTSSRKYDEYIYIHTS